MSDYNNGYDEGYRAGMQKVREVGQARIEELEAELAKAVEALQLADAAMSGANMNMSVVERKVKAAIAETVLI